MSHITLDVSRLQTGRLRLYCESFDIARIIKTVGQPVGYDLERRRRFLQVTMPHDNVIVFWDRLHIKLVLLNIVASTVKYAWNEGQSRSMCRTIQQGHRIRWSSW